LGLEKLGLDGAPLDLQGANASPEFGTRVGTGHVSVLSGNR
jgi:hypothetical protein